MVDLHNELLVLQIPKFTVEFVKDKAYGYSSEEKKKSLKETLVKASNGYCMYCYRRIVLDRQNNGHLEHGIEKENSSKLFDCVPNISIVCGSCNMSRKKKGEKKRKLEKKVIEEFEKSKCIDGCVKPCNSYEKLKELYIENEESKIILQPLGVRGKETGESLELEYDVLDTEFKPSSKYQYSDNEKEFINKHIVRFKLNDREQKTEQLIKFLRDTINNNGIYTTVEYNNMIVELFVKQLEGRSREEILKICSTIYEYEVVKFNT